MTDYGILRASGLPISWTVIRMGWLSSPHSRFHLVAEDVQAFAAEQLATCSEEQAYPVFRLYDAEPRNMWEFDRCLEELAGSSPEDFDRARRIVNLAFLKDILARMRDNVTPFDTSEDDVCELVCFWEDSRSPGFWPCDEYDSGGQVSTHNYLEAHHAWARNEEADLLGSAMSARWRPRREM